MDDFTRGYLVCALWTATGEEGIPLDRTYDVDEFTLESVKLAVDVCADFQSANADLLAQAYELYPPRSAHGCSPEDYAGHDLWLTRNHHGAGFWDRGLGAIGEELTKRAHAYGECSVYVADGALHFAEG